MIKILFLFLSFVIADSNENSLTVIFNNTDITPMAICCSDLKNNIIFFTNFLSPEIYYFNTESGEYNLLYSFSNKNIKLYGITVINNQIYVSVHAYDEDYNPIPDNGIWVVGNTTRKIFPLKGEKFLIGTGIERVNDNLIYFNDAGMGNVWWLDTITLHADILIGIGKKNNPDYYRGYSGIYVNNLPEYNQGNKGIGILGIKITNTGYLLLANYGLGIVVQSKLSSDYKSVIGEIKPLYNVNIPIFCLTSLDYDNSTGYIYIGTALNCESNLIVSHTILRTKIDGIDFNIYSDNYELASISDLLIVSNRMFVSTYDPIYNHGLIYSLQLN